MRFLLSVIVAPFLLAATALPCAAQQAALPPAVSPSKRAAAAAAAKAPVSARRTRGIAAAASATTISGTYLGLTPDGAGVRVRDEQTRVELIAPLARVTGLFQRRVVGNVALLVSGLPVSLQLGTSAAAPVPAGAVVPTPAPTAAPVAAVRAPDIVTGTITALWASGLDVQSPQGETVRFTVSPKTRWRRGDADAVWTAFPVGTSVAVKTRKLPGGGLFALVVAPTGAEVAQFHRDGLRIWQGRVASVNPDYSFTLSRDDGAMRRVVLAPGASVIQNRLRVSVRDLPVGTWVRVTMERLPASGSLAASGPRRAEKVSVPAREPAAARDVVDTVDTVDNGTE